jgi:transketolase
MSRSGRVESKRSPKIKHNDLANAIRALAMDAVEQANSGHPGMPMGMADVATVLFTRFLRYDAANPDWPDRDRFVLSAGHGSMLLYALLYLAGYPDMDIGQIRKFRQLGSLTPGHPEHGHVGGIETTTGPLGQGIANAVGMAIAERHLAARFGEDLVNHRTFVIAGDGDLMEGISHEAASLAGHLRLSRLIVLFDDNEISIDGPTSLAVGDDTLGRFAAYGWRTDSVDGHDPAAIAKAIKAACSANRPSLIACRTVIGFGAPSKQGSSATHGAPLGDAEIAAARVALDWPHVPFEIPDDILGAWREAGRRGSEECTAWRKRVRALASERRTAFEGALAGDLPKGWSRTMTAFRKKLAVDGPTWATRKASQEVLEVINEAVPQTLGGSADLTGSNNTRTKALDVLSPKSYGGRYIHYGVREHAMAAAMNGMALHGGVIPYGGTFLVFSDYLRPALRLSALMNQRVIYVLTHDSIGLGEDGPTHQPVEHLASLRAIPNVAVFRPADAVETAECWQLAIERRSGPSVIALSRQNLPPVRRVHAERNLSAGGAYELSPSEGAPRVTLIGTGSEVAIALEAQTTLQSSGIPTRVVSMPCCEVFEARADRDREEILRPDTLRVSVEAAVPLGWGRFVGPDGIIVGMTGFGASAPATTLYRHFGITAEAIVAAVKKRVG